MASSDVWEFVGVDFGGIWVVAEVGGCDDVWFLCDSLAFALLFRANRVFMGGH